MLTIRKHDNSLEENFLPSSQFGLVIEPLMISVFGNMAALFPFITDIIFPPYFSCKAYSKPISWHLYFQKTLFLS
ncbi:hypothetical protein SY86_07160 [Erwinia tracheiphila]|uniref:Uncharacterized protein n=1 Tax=Erwinia tracheiphila TaxID=65700 RepID=A0A0M2K787_9GAMM|nr:hypothetical protein AV903_11425 [Erwinia tracheiphila]KKF35255.1 hypothetical protein SY86_07160 [Erwinia tracheiphila]